MQRSCTNCLKDVPAGARYCPRCGHAVDANQAVVAMERARQHFASSATVVAPPPITKRTLPTKPVRPPQKSTGGGVWGGLSVFALIVIISFFCTKHGDNDAPNSVSNLSQTLPPLPDSPSNDVSPRPETDLPLATSMSNAIRLAWLSPMNVDPGGWVGVAMHMNLALPVNEQARLTVSVLAPNGHIEPDLSLPPDSISSSRGLEVTRMIDTSGSSGINLNDVTVVIPFRQLYRLPANSRLHLRAILYDKTGHMIGSWRDMEYENKTETDYVARVQVLHDRSFASGSGEEEVGLRVNVMAKAGSSPTVIIRFRDAFTGNAFQGHAPYVDSQGHLQLEQAVPGRREMGMALGQMMSGDIDMQLPRSALPADAYRVLADVYLVSDNTSRQKPLTVTLPLR